LKEINNPPFLIFAAKATHSENGVCANFNQNCAIPAGIQIQTAVFLSE
jgi:hypothetical protein